MPCVSIVDQNRAAELWTRWGGGGVWVETRRTEFPLVEITSPWDKDFRYSGIYKKVSFSPHQILLYSRL